MNKFGIFNLLNSFLDLGEQKKQSNEQESSSKADLLSSLISSINSTPQKNKEQNQSYSSPPMPLQKSMLDAISSHDQFVKRVKNSQPKTDKN